MKGEGLVDFLSLIFFFNFNLKKEEKKEKDVATVAWITAYFFLESTYLLFLKSRDSKSN